MARVGLSSPFTTIPVGTYTFKVTESNYKADFGKMVVKLETENGLKHSESFFFLDNTGKQNDKAISAYSYFARSVLNLKDYDGDIDDSWLVGASIVADVTHTEANGKTYSHLTNYQPVDEVKPNLPKNYESFFDNDLQEANENDFTAPSAPVQETPVAPTPAFNLDDFLND